MFSKRKPDNRQGTFSLNNVSALAQYQRRELVRFNAERLFRILVFALLLQLGWIALAFFTNHFTGQSALPVVMFIGVLGGVIGLQNRLKSLSDDDLILLSQSWRYMLLAPLVGGFLAMLLYVMFISGLVKGDLFPAFRFDHAGENALQVLKENGIKSLFMIHAVSYESYAKLIVWCFIAGFSERFVTNIIGRLENASGQPTDAQRQAEQNTGSPDQSASDRIEDGSNDPFTADPPVPLPAKDKPSKQ